MLRRLNTASFRSVRSVYLKVRQYAATHSEFDNYCMNNVRDNDHSRFVAGLLFPKEYRGVYYALHAFNVEIATIRDQIPRNSVQAGRIRFQFWKDTLQQIYGGAGLSGSNNQPVAKSLNFYIKKHNLTSRWFERALEARYLYLFPQFFLLFMRDF